jgi:hypothetical protein
MVEVEVELKDNSRWNPYIGLVKSLNQSEGNDLNRSQWETYVAERVQVKDTSLNKSWNHINRLVKSIGKLREERKTFIKIVD